ncbi:hypothetical protein PACTADRAFT_69681 [Pachysolen tannophilus NRRL Y-2460]|uniref:Eukaryotic translation initiation factor 3 subunit B n=1 Tax=Pachysolen tannophilus NRRL Y-2460 TaxID=669874 RepID=A0A1E4TSL1_PACTA|nr:hypothetical protein PACTADRAFT_69681 [Pachysolen tannophilus NRRL Y-2460]
MPVEEEQEIRIDESAIPIDDIDFSDLEAKYAIPEDDSLSHFIIVDGAPIAPESKVAVLKKVLTKVFSAAGKVTDMYMPVENGQTKGFVFVEFEDISSVDIACKKLNNKKLDVKHTLFVNKLSDVEKYGVKGHVSDEFVEPKIEPYHESPYLKSWLQDYNGRDQFVLQKGDEVGVYWSKNKNDPEPAVEPRQNWTQAFVRFSPKGSYLFSMHEQGIQAWGGPEFSRLKRFFHPNARLIDFSPCENYLVSLSPTPIEVPAEDHPARASFPFGPESEGHKLIIWDIKSGLPTRTFALPPNLENEKKMVWPLVKWSYDDKYCARMGPDALAVYETSDFQLLDKKLIKIEGIVDFEWAPAGVKLAASKNKDADQHVLTYWTPEQVNQTARVALMQIPSREVIRTVNLFQVSDCKLHWQDEARFLCVKVDRHTKSKKTIFTSLEFFHLFEKDIPVEKLELKDSVINFSWEPKGERFVTISILDVGGNVNPAIARNTLTFFGPEEEKIKNKTKLNIKKWTAFASFEKKHSNTIEFSPKGRFVAVATIIGNNHGEIEFYDLDYDGTNKESSTVNNTGSGNNKYFALTDIAWDPSGRYLAAWSSSWRHKIENGYRLYDFAGHLLREEVIDQFKTFYWRPRPQSLLSSNDRKKVRKNLREYSAQFEEADAMEADVATRELILKRRKLFEDWNSWRSEIEKIQKDLGLTQEEETEDVNEEVVEEIREEVLEEKEEVVE